MARHWLQLDWVQRSQLNPSGWVWTNQRRAGMRPLRNRGRTCDCLGLRGVTGRDTVKFFGYIRRQRGVNRLLFMSNLDRTSGNEIQYAKGDLGQWGAQEECKIFVVSKNGVNKLPPIMAQLSCPWERKMDSPYPFLAGFYRVFCSRTDHKL